MQKGMGLRQKLLGSYLLMAVLVFVAGGVGLYFTAGEADQGIYVAERLNPLSDAIMEMEIAATKAHLIFEEIVSGDANEDVEEVYGLLDEAQWFCGAILRGAEHKTRGTIHATTDPRVLARMKEVEASLKRFRSAAEMRYRNFKSGEEGSGVGSEADAAFDAEFDGMLTSAQEAEEFIIAAVGDAVAGLVESKESATWIVGLVAVFSVVVALGVGFLVANAITQPLHLVVQAGRRIADGETRQTVLDVRSDDEIGELAAAFNAMLQYLAEVSDVMDQIANGRLRVDVKPKSADDVLGTSVAKMVDGLRDLIARVQEASDQISAASEELASGAQAAAQGAQQIAQGAERQSATVEETVATIEEVSAAMQEIAASTRAQREAMETARTLVETSARSLEGMAQSARQVSESAQNASDVAERGSAAMGQTIGSMREIGQRSDRVGEIVSVIDDIAEQINLLALNAAIEAARAGEHGRGFAVVAEGVTKLAERSKQAAQAVAGVIKETRQLITSGMEHSDKATVALNELTGGIGRVNTLVKSISGSINDEAESGAQVARAIGQLDQSARQIDQGVEEQNRRSEELTRAADVLGDISQQNATVAEESSAQAEESSSATEELAAQAQALQQAVSVFEA